jgi:uncharacterized membrane protein YcaP (DUF421 family)
MPSVLDNMFTLQATLLVEKILRPIVVYLFLIVSFRLAGKRELAQLNPFDLVVLLTISNTVQNAIIGNDNSVTGGLIGAATLLAVNYLVVRYLYGHRRLDRLIEGDSDVLIDGGRIRRDRLRRELITETELLSAAHKQGIDSLADVDRCVLEPGGTLVFQAVKPTPDTIRQTELMSRLDRIAADLAALRARGGPATAPGTTE